MKRFIISSLIFALSATSTYAKATYEDEQNVALQGTITWVKAYGPPNYGETPKIDKQIKYPAVTLKEGFYFKNTSGFGNDEPNVKTLQLVPNGEQDYGDFPRSGCVVVKGNLFAAETANHYTPVLIQGTAKPCK